MYSIRSNPCRIRGGAWSALLQVLTGIIIRVKAKQEEKKSVKSTEIVIIVLGEGEASSHIP